LEKTAFTEADMGDPIYMHVADDDGREGDFICDMIKHVKTTSNGKFQDFAVLYRTNRQSRAVEVAMTQMGIPYQVVGGHAFYDRKEIKDLVAYLRAINNGLDVLAFNRIINVPKRGIGDASVNKIQTYATECGIPFSRALESVEDVPKVPKKAAASIADFLTMMREFQAFVTSDEFSVAELIRMVLAKTQYMESLNPEKEEDLARMENIEELINVAGKWDEEVQGEGKGLTEFLTETSLVSDIDSMEDMDAVTLMTVHASKGLEFKNVFLIGLEEGIFPHGRSMKDMEEMEEERRLMYVAMTRAEKKLIISRCVQRYEYGVPKPIYNKPSRFLNEIPTELVQKI
jgi:DNA helicase-2/ATP-dependent DNA helicase PcrA